MSSLVATIERFRSRFDTWVWASSNDASRRILLLRVTLTVIRGIIGDRIWLRAGNMTYLSLLHLVPLGALALALSRGLGWQETLVEWIQRRLSPTAPELASRLVAAMDRLDVVAIGYVGLAAIILASVVALSELETDLGDIFETQHPRHWGRRIWMYPLAIVLAPTVLTGVLVLGAIAEARTTALLGPVANWGALGEWLHQWLTRLPLVFELVPYLLTWTVFTALYRLATPASIGWGSAAVGGVFTGIVWQMAQGVYIGFQLGASTYREIWGYLAQIPLLLIWIYVSWGIVFVGAEVVYAWQNRVAYMPKWRMTGLMSFDALQRATASVAAGIQRCVMDTGKPVEVAEVSGCVRLPLGIVRQCAAKLQEIRLIEANRDRLVPTTDLAGTTVADLGNRLKAVGGGWLPMTGQAPLTDDMTIGQVAEIESQSAQSTSSPTPP